MAASRLSLISQHLVPQSNPTLWVMANFEPLTFEKVGSLKGKTLFITGASRGIGLEIGLRAAQDGPNVVIAAKTSDPHPKLEGTIFTAAKDIEKAGGKALPIICDVRDEKSVQAAVEKAVQTFGGIDILINNASAIYQSTVEDTDMKKHDLSMSVNTRGTFLASKYCIPYLRKSKNPHILTISPPLQAASDPKVNWFGRYCVGYVFSKLGMTFVTHVIHQLFLIEFRVSLKNLREMESPATLSGPGP